MLINVFGAWLNPDKVDVLETQGVNVHIIMGEAAVRVLDSTAQEVAEEINKQIKASKQ